MSEHPSPARTHIKRSRYFVDSRLQLAVVVPLLGILAVVAVAYAAAIYLLPGASALKSMSADETRSLFLRANIVYFAIAAAGIGAAAVYLTHRIAGPVVVIERALRAMQRGNYGQRLSLRPSDLLPSLAAAVRDLRSRLVEEAEQRRRLAEEVADRLDAGDLDEARKLLVQLGSPEEHHSPTHPTES